MRLQTFGMLTLLGLAACEPDSKNSDDSSDDESGGGSGGGSGLDGTDGTDGTDGGGGDGGDGGDGSDGGGGKEDCQVALELSVWMDADTWDIGLLTTDGYSNDAGIQGIFDVIPNDGDEVTEQMLPVVEATVVNVGYAPEGGTPNVYLQDAAGAIMTYYVETSADVKPGDKVSFTATAATNYFGTREITGLEDFTIVSSGNPVHYNVGHGTDLDFASIGLQNVHVWGELTASQGECGSGTECFDLTHGDKTVTYRIRTEYLEYPDQVGDCVDLFAPLGSFSGAPQLNIDNYDWRWVSY